jgi:ATP synthase protein I
MNKKPENTTKKTPTLAEQVGTKATRKLKARHHEIPGLWVGLGMIGLIGWAVVVPTLLGAALGIWLDEHHPGKHPWTLALLVAGLAIGCFNAWLWIEKEGKAMHNDPKNKEDNDDK